jgi:3-oxoacyl-(acyl-carrier-protein) synthase
MRRVVVTGMGIVSSIGNNADEVTESLRDAKSGISFSEDFAEHGFRSQVWGAPTLDPTETGRPPRHALPVARRRLEPCRHEPGDRRCWP